MINLSSSAKIRLQDNQKVLFKAEFTLDTTNGRNSNFTSNSILNLTGDDVMGGTATITDATTSSGSLDVGSAIINSLSITLNNFDDRFSLYDFAGATMKVYLGIPLADNVTNQNDTTQVEWFVKGFYTVDKPTSVGNTIPLTMLDNMSKFEVLFNDLINITYPATAKEILDEICLRCGVTVAVSIPNPSYTIESAPEDDNLTCLDVIGFLAQINGCYARMNRLGQLTFGWYNTDEFENDTGDDLNGGTFLTSTTPYSDGDNADGGTFDGSSEAYVDSEGVSRVRYANPSTDISGGTFSWGDYGVLNAFSSFSVATEDITITGIKFIVDNLDENSEETTNTYLYDAQGVISDTETTRKANALVYALEISGNKLMPLLTQDDNVNYLSQCMSYIANKIVGFTIRPFNVTALSNPQYEAGDPVKLVANKGDTYNTFITNISYPLNGYETYSCEAQTVSERNAVSTSPLSTAIAEVKNETSKKFKSYDESVKYLSSLSANALGFYETVVDTLEGGRIVYMHEKSTLETSLIAYQKSASGFFIGSRNAITEDWDWVGGVDMDANAVYKTLTAKGINADWINTGTLKVGGLSGNTNGSIEVYNVKTSSTGEKTEEIVGKFNKDGINVYKGTITGASFGDGNPSTTTKINIKSNTNTRLVFGGTSEGGYPNGCNVITGTHEKWYHDGFGTLYSGNHADGTFVHYDTVRRFYNGGSLYQECQWGDAMSSDRRLKKDIEDIEPNVIRKFFNKLRPVSFKYKNEELNDTHYGYIAQDIKDIIDELELNERMFLSNDIYGYYELVYSSIDRLSSMAIHDLYQIVDRQQQEIGLLKEQINQLLNK